MSIRGVGERQAVWLITAVAVIGRLATLQQPMRYDESITWAYFVGKPWSTVVSAYQFPNNHVFFSLLAKATSTLAPFQPWALRLPAFLAGVVVVPLVWAVGRRFANPAVGLLGAALAAGSTPLALYSTNARGYSLVVALFLLLLLLADRIRCSARMRDFAAFAVVGALGLYTIPVMLYPLGVAATWLLIAAWRGPPALRARIVVGAAEACAAAGSLAVLLYLPIVRTSGIGALAGNNFVQPSTWADFLAALPRHLLATLFTWASPFPWWSMPLLLLLALVGLPRAKPAARPSLALAAALWCGVLLLATHRAPYVRVWLFLLPLFLLALARGLVRVADRTRGIDVVRRPLTAVVLAAGVATMALLGDTVRESDDTGTFPAARDVTAALAPRLRAGDRVLAVIPLNGPLLYYFAAAGVDTSLLNTPPERTRRAFLVLDPPRGHTLNWAVSVGMIDPAAYGDPTPVVRRPDVELWQADRR